MTPQIKYTATDVSPLPIVARSKEGFEFYPNDNIWIIVDQVHETHFKFDEFMKYYDTTIIISFKHTLIHYIQTFALSHPRNMYNIFLNFTRSLTIESSLIYTISSIHFINYKAHLGKDEW